MIIIVFMGASEDLLFFKSDQNSLLHFFSGFALVFSLPFLCLFALGVRAGWWQAERLQSVLLAVLLSLLILGFYVFLVDYLVKTSFRPWRNEYRNYYGWILLVGILLSVGINFILPDVESRKRSLLKLAHVTCVAGVVIFFSMTALVRLGAQRSHKHVVLIIMDRLSTRYLSAYTPEAAPTPGYDEVAKNSLLFSNMHTNRTYTHGFFRIFYSGQKRGKADPRNNLVYNLQKSDVSFKWVGCHGNGLPDTHAVKYDGLRGLLLNQNFAWLPHLLGVPYHLYWYDRRFGRGKAIRSRDEWLTEVTADYFAPVSFFDDVAMAELKTVRSFNKPTFTILYTDESAGLQPSAPWCSDDSPACLTERRIDKRDYAYVPEEEPWVKAQEAKYVERVKVATDALARFFKKFEQSGWAEDTLVLVTADHGSIYDKGRIWYTFHAEEEVARVPFLVRLPNKVGVDGRFFESIDITQTILSFLGIESQLNPKAMSVLDAAEKPYTTSLTKESKDRKEFFINVYEEGRKYTYNIFNVDDIKLESSSPISPKFDIRQLLMEYGCERGC